MRVGQASALGRFPSRNRHKDIFIRLRAGPQGQNQPSNRSLGRSLVASLGTAGRSGDTPPMADHKKTDDKDFGIWDGEVAVELPQAFDASLYYIGRIHTPWKARKDCPKN